jgi:hypothetical protein
MQARASQLTQAQIELLTVTVYAAAVVGVVGLLAWLASSGEVANLSGFEHLDAL